MTRQPSPARLAIISILFITLVVAALVYFDAHEEVLRLLDWLDAQGLWGPLLFVFIMVIVVLFLLPGVLFTTGAGFVFGVVEGTLCVVVGTTLGAILAFLAARHLFGERARRYLLHHAKLHVVTEELAQQDWKIVALTRLVPFFPFKLSNYFFGLTPFTLRGFAGGTFLGIIPLSLNSVYLGSVAADISLEGVRSTQRTPIEWGIYIAGLFATIGLVIYLNRLAQRALAKYTAENGKDASP